MLFPSPPLLMRHATPPEGVLQRIPIFIFSHRFAHGYGVLKIAETVSQAFLNE
jgi:hypothetical protein